MSYLSHAGLTRRDLLLGAGVVAASRIASAAPAKLLARPFPLDAVRLLDGPLKTSLELNRSWLQRLESERLIHTFRTNSGMISGAKPLGGWEAPSMEIRGHFTGHFLSAAAALCASGDKMLKLKADGMVSDLARCQAKLGGGYLSAFPAEFFDRLREGKKVWVPFYTFHKVLAGMIDMYRLAGNKEALQVAEGMGQWTVAYLNTCKPEQLARMLDVEFGGMGESLLDLHGITRNDDYLGAARKFEHARLVEPLAQRRDELTGLHANTQLPKVLAAAREFELTGNPRYRQIAEFFWRQVTRQRCYSTGGTSNREHWNRPPGMLASELSDRTQECCCTHNMLKLTRQVFSWTADAKVADYYERALFNGVLGTQNPEDGSFLYYVPLASGYWKVWSRPHDSFWCCVGTGSEAFARLNDSIYFHDDTGVWVNLFTPSEVSWTAKGVKLRQQTRFPDEASTAIHVTAAQPARFELRIRVPYWITQDFKVHLNGAPVEAGFNPSSYFVIDRLWKTGDRVEINLPMELHSHAMPDSKSLQSIMYGPLVLAGDLGTAGLTPDSYRGSAELKIENHVLEGAPVPAPVLQPSGDSLAAWIKRDPAAPLRFRASSSSGDVTLLPLNRVVKQRYAVYWPLA